MSFDGIFTRAMVSELNRVGKRKNRKSSSTLSARNYLTVRANRKNKRVLLSAHPSYARLQIIEDSLSIRSRLQTFVWCSEKLEGAIIEGIRQLGNDRIVIFSFRNFDELGDQQQLELIVELMGRHSNIFLIDKESRIIIDCPKARAFLPEQLPASIRSGAHRNLPPHQDRSDLFALEPEEIKAPLPNSILKPLCGRLCNR